MRAPLVDSRGLAEGPVTLVSSDRCHSVLSPEADGRFAIERWNHGARRYFEHELLARTPKSYDAGWPITDAGLIDVNDSDGGTLGSVVVVTAPIERAPALLDAARAAVLAMGGAGFDVLVARARRVWQVVALDVDDRGPCEDGHSMDAVALELLVAAVFASTLLGPVLAPDGALFGVKTARERLGRLSARGAR